MASFSSFVALRYLKSNKENRFFSWIAILSVSGIAIGVAAMIVVLSVINGFETELRNRFLSANAHILAYRYPGGMKDPDQWADVIKHDFGKAITGIAPFVHYETMIKSGPIMHSILVRGISPIARESVQSLRSSIFPPEALDILQQEMDAKRAGKPLPGLPRIILGKGILKIIGRDVGDTVDLIAPTSGQVGDMRTFRIVGAYESGLKHYDNKLAAMSLTTAQEFFGMHDRVTGIEIGLIEPNNSPAIAADMENRYALSIREWQSFNEPLFRAMETERVVIALIVALVALVAGFNILTTIFVSVSQKQRDISVLKALGARNSQVISLFLKQGMYIGLIGGIAGSLLALGISYVLETYPFIELPDPYFLSQLPIDYDWRIYLSITLSGIFICLIASLYPASIAAMVNPSEGFRGTGHLD